MVKFLIEATKISQHTRFPVFCMAIGVPGVTSNSFRLRRAEFGLFFWRMFFDVSEYF